MKLTSKDLLEVEKELCNRSLSEFVKLAWKVIDPGNAYIHNWHMDAVCEHLESVTNGEIKRLLINVPPGTSKSSLVSVYWNAWEWACKSMPHLRSINASHEQGLAVRDTMKMRRLIMSDWFKERWNIDLVGDQNQKTNFENSSTGFRQACAVSSMTGRRGDRIIWDDPHSVEASLSDKERDTALRVFQETLPTRLNSPEHSSIVIVMQRLHENDVSGYILENDLGYEHLCLPMEFEKNRKCYTSIGFEDPRTLEGELLFPERFTQDVVERDKKVMGEYATAGQFQQRPTPRSGGFFKWENIEVVKSTPKIIEKIRYWDKAGTDGGGAYTAGVHLGRGEDDYYYILDVVRGQWSAPQREKTIKQTAEIDGTETIIWIEQEPGSGGKESAESTVRNLAGYTIKSERATGDKAVRAEPYSIQVEAGNIKILKANWNQDFINEHKSFPVGKYKDQIDAAGGAFNKLTIKSSGSQIYIPKSHRK